MARLVLSGREEAQLPLSQHAATGLGASGLAQGHQAAAEEIGKQSRTVATSSLLQRRDQVTVGPAGLEDHCCPSAFVCGGENWALRLQKPDQAKASGGENPCCPQRPLGVGLRVACSAPGLSAEPGLAAVPCLLWAVAMPRSAGEAPRQVFPQPAWPGERGGTFSSVS